MSNPDPLRKACELAAKRFSNKVEWQPAKQRRELADLIEAAVRPVVASQTNALREIHRAVRYPLTGPVEGCGAATAALIELLAREAIGDART